MLEPLDYLRMHFTELRTVALVEDEDNVLVGYLLPLIVILLIFKH